MSLDSTFELDSNPLHSFVFYLLKHLIKKNFATLGSCLANDIAMRNETILRMLKISVFFWSQKEKLHIQTVMAKNSEQEADWRILLSVHGGGGEAVH